MYFLWPQESSDGSNGRPAEGGWPQQSDAGFLGLPAGQPRLPDAGGIRLPETPALSRKASKHFAQPLRTIPRPAATLQEVALQLNVEPTVIPGPLQPLLQSPGSEPPPGVGCQSRSHGLPEPMQPGPEQPQAVSQPNLLPSQPREELPQTSRRQPLCSPTQTQQPLLPPAAKPPSGPPLAPGSGQNIMPPPESSRILQTEPTPPQEWGPPKPQLATQLQPQPQPPQPPQQLPTAGRKQVQARAARAKAAPKSDSLPSPRGQPRRSDTRQPIDDLVACCLAKRRRLAPARPAASAVKAPPYPDTSTFELLPRLAPIIKQPPGCIRWPPETGLPKWMPVKQPPNWKPSPFGSKWMPVVFSKPAPVKPPPPYYPISETVPAK